jgi:S1-C subfamily serine protease
MKSIIILLISVILIMGCSYTRSQVLIHPNNGKTIKCENTGWGWGYIGYPVMCAMVNKTVDQCINTYKQTGYIEIEKFPSTGIFFDTDFSKEPVIIKILSNSPAMNAGLKVGDKIVEKNGVPVKTTQELRLPPYPNKGDRVEYKVLREGNELVFKVEFVPISTLLMPK